MLARVLSCIACDGVRQEPGGKATILGFAGVLPDAKVSVGSEGSTDLCLFISTLGEGEAELAFELLDPFGAVVAEPSGVNVNWDGKDSLRSVVLSIPDVDLLKEGRYTLAVLSEGMTAYASSFEVKN